jgi:lysophospholipase L1-like esterase
MNVYEYITTGENEKPLDRMVTDGGFTAIFRTIACIGDSLSSGEFESLKDGVKGYHDCFEYSWGQFLGRSCGAKVYNFSRGGMTAHEYIESFADANDFWSKDKLAQAYIIALGVNDLLGKKIEIGSISDIDMSYYTKNGKTFTGYYAQIIQRIKELQPRAKIFLMSIPNKDDDNQEVREAHRNLLAELTDIFDNTYLVDLYTYAPVADADFEKSFWLGHMTPMGYILIARMVESYIDYIIRKNPEEFNQVGFIGTDLYYNP